MPRLLLTPDRSRSSFRWTRPSSSPRVGATRLHSTPTDVGGDGGGGGGEAADLDSSSLSSSDLDVEGEATTAAAMAAAAAAAAIGGIEQQQEEASEPPVDERKPGTTSEAVSKPVAPAIAKSEFVSKQHSKAGPFRALLVYVDYVRWLWIATDKERLDREQAGDQVSERVKVRRPRTKLETTAISARASGGDVVTTRRECFLSCSLRK